MLATVTSKWTLTKPTDIEAVVVEVPVVAKLYLILTDRPQHQEHYDGNSTERCHPNPSSAHHICHHCQLITPHTRTHPVIFCSALNATLTLAETDDTSPRNMDSDERCDAGQYVLTNN